MPALIDMNLVEEILGGDPVLLPEEAAALLGITENVLYDRAVAGTIPSIQPGGPNGPRRYRRSAITRTLRDGDLVALWPGTLTSSARTLLSHLQGAGVATVGDLAACDADTLAGFGLRPGQVDHVRLVLARKGLTLQGEDA